MFKNFLQFKESEKDTLPNFFVLFCFVGNNFKRIAKFLLAEKALLN
jgi:hypothetical protein